MSRQRAPLIHGTRHGYDVWQCRCPKCCEAQAQYRRAYRARWIPPKTTTVLPDGRKVRECASCGESFELSGLPARTRRCTPCRKASGDAGIRGGPRVPLPPKVHAAPSSSWWITAPPTGFTARAEAESARMQCDPKFSRVSVPGEASWA